MHKNKMTQKIDDITYDSIAVEEINEVTLTKWSALPENVRNDPCFEAYQKEQRKRNERATNDDQNSSTTVTIIYYSKTIGLALIWIFIAFYLLTVKEKVLHSQLISIPRRSGLHVPVVDVKPKHSIRLVLEGYFTEKTLESNCTNCLQVNIFANASYGIRFVPDQWNISAQEPPWNTETKRRIKSTDIFVAHHSEPATVNIFISNFMNKDFPIDFKYDLHVENPAIGIILATLILIFLYGLIIWDVVHRTFAALLSSSLSIACLAAVNDRPTMLEIVKWIDFETILLLFSMMLITSILTETGIFNYLAIIVYKITRGKVWALIHCLCILTTCISAFLDNVTTTLLMSPITITLCEVANLNPVPVLMMIVIHANIGGTTTPVGDPPNVIITSNAHVKASGVSFITFSKYMGGGVLICVLSTAVFLRIIYRNDGSFKFNGSKVHDTKKTEEEIQQWEEALQELKNETLKPLKEIIEQKLNELKNTAENNRNEINYEAKIKMMEKMYPIKDKSLLIKCGVILVFVISLFLIESVPEIQRLSLSWCALLGVLLLLVISNKDDMDEVLSKIEWATLVFFAAMFIIMEIVDRLGLIKLIGDITKDLILSVPQSFQLSLAIIIVLWVSGLVSAFIDSIPVTVMMVKVVVSLVENKTLNLPLQPLIWALAFGPCLGGNGTLVGASANVVCAAIAQKRGYKISFIDFFKLGFPVMLVTLTIVTLYLVLLYV